MQYIAADGRRASAAEASFLTLSHAPGKRFWLKLYRHVLGFAPISELAYAFIAAHRSAFYRISLGARTTSRRAHSCSCGCLDSSISQPLSPSPCRRKA